MDAPLRPAAFGCADCTHLRARGEAITRRGSRSEATPWLEAPDDVEPVLRLWCAHGPSAAAALDEGVLSRVEFDVENVDGIDQASTATELALVAEHPGAVSLAEIPPPVRPRWCRLEV